MKQHPLIQKYKRRFGPSTRKSSGYWYTYLNETRGYWYTYLNETQGHDWLVQHGATEDEAYTLLWEIRTIYTEVIIE